MKSFLTGILIFTLFNLVSMSAKSQPPLKNYDASWKKVEEFVKKRLPQSALAEVKKIYALAKKEKQDAQVIRSLVYIAGLQGETREENHIASIRDFEAELKTARQPVTSILNSLLAELYWNYYQQNRWEMFSRTQTVAFKKEDIATWTAEDFYARTSELYLASIKEQKILQQTSLKSFDAIITRGNTRHLRPTLYDLLAHRAIGYFENDERDVNKPAYAFEIDQASAFDPAADFIHRKFPTKDSLSLYHKALLIYQQLISFHLNDPKPDALIDVDLARIQFVKSKSIHPDKDQQYFNAINHIAHQYASTPAAAQAWYLLALYHKELGDTYTPAGDSSLRFEKIKAKEIAEKIVLQKDSSEGKINAYNLLQEIQRQELQFHVEKVNVPEQPFRALIEYKNFNTLYLRLIKADASVKALLEKQYEEKSWAALIKTKTLKTWQQVLPATNDLQKHQVEIKVDGLPAGEYLLLAGTGENFANAKVLIGARLFYVSAISFVSNKDDFFVLNRDNGQPLKGAKIQEWENEYDYNQSKYIRKKTNLYTADANGFFRRQKTTQNKNNTYRNVSYLLDITHGTDRLFMDEQMNDYYYRGYMPDGQDIPMAQVFFFTDRSLYRPGQTVYFKGIMLLKANGKSDIVTGRSTTVYLRDANNQNIDSLQLKTSEFGSFSGKFQLPSGGLNGGFAIYATNSEGEGSFMVEDYKRPKFYVEYEPLKGSYQVNDSIRITGVAKAYAGNNIDGAQVKYRVVRVPRFIYPWLTRKWWMPPSEPQEITNGVATTDKDGHFQITFMAIPDRKIDKKLDPVFDYTVYADVTDINGETRSGEQQVSVSYKALLLKTTIPAAMPVDSLKKLLIRTENMNGQFEPAQLTITISKLKPEQRLIRERFWERPDQFVMTKEEYIRNFPYDEYNNETDNTTWEKLAPVFQKTDSSSQNGWILESRKWEPGFYAIEISTKDKNGQEVKDIAYTELFDPNASKLNVPQYLWAQTAKPIEPGEKTSVQLGSSADNLFVVQSLDRESTSQSPEAGITSYSYLQLNNETKSIPFTATEADRGSYGAGWVFIKHNRFHYHGETIQVPWTNKDLTVEYATYRDKTLPGSEEKWKLKISGYKNEKVAAELLASMYDASLDQFYPHTWGTPYIWPSFYQSATWNSRINFSQIESAEHRNEETTEKWLDKRYDVLLNGGQDEYKYNFRKKGRERMMAVRSAAPVADQEVAMNYSVQYDANPQAGWGFTISDKKETNAPPAQQPAPAQETQVRRNFNETAFFFPELRTDADGAVEFSFTLPDALTKWKFQALAHTSDLKLGYSSKEIITQKQLMVQPNPPRFLREGDKLEFSAKIVNLTEKELTGRAEISVFDAATNLPLDSRFRVVVPSQYFTVAAGQSEAVKFAMEVPFQFNKAVTWRIIAKADAFSDGEEAALPVLSNRMLVTETMPLPMRGFGSKDFSFTKLINSANSETLQQHSLTLEYTSNPAWYAVQALPYLLEYPYECAEQTWNRYYANSLAQMIANSSPRIREVFAKWKTSDTAALQSNLQKNPELKSILLQETPWVLAAKTEAEQKKNIALLFDMVRMGDQLNSSYDKLKQMQSPNGGFVWFTGGPDDRYITQYIVSGIGHLKKLKGIAAAQEEKLNAILQLAIPYLDGKIKQDYDNLVKSKVKLAEYAPGYTEVQYLYMRSFFPEYKIPAASLKAYNYFKGRLPLTWTKQNKYMQGMTALFLHRNADIKTPAVILKSLKETSINNEELGMYWKDASRGWWWYEAPVERQALIIEAFQEIAGDTKTVDDLRTWLLKNKQTNKWESTKATAEACYALLLQGSQWLTAEPVITVKLGNTTVSSADNKLEAGTGYFTKTIDGEKIRPDMGNIGVTVTAPANATAGQSSSTWGAVYWQYFEDLDKITTAGTPLKLAKKLFVEKNSDRGPVLTPVNDGDYLKVGDKIKVRVELRVDRDMEYVHMKDMRASALEPVNVLSGYKWQGGLGYYESTRDASTNFFFNSLRKGTYVFEYPLFVTHTGNFSNGVTTIQCMYAPEFTAHSEGIRINVE